MPQWKNTDAAGNSVLWAAASVKLNPNTGNQTALFGNTTGNSFITNQTVGQFGVGAAEMRAARAGDQDSGKGRPASAGWVLKTTGQGGRAGRVTYETLVAMKTISGDAEDTAFGDYALQFLLHPASLTVNASSASANQGFLSVSANSVPAGANISYYWQRWNGSAFVNCSANATYANITNSVLVVSANTLATNADIIRCIAASANAVVANNIPSSNAVLTKTT